jgi:transcription factor IIIB subunit 2
MGGMYGNRGGGESREQTIANGAAGPLLCPHPRSRSHTAQRRIQGVAGVLRLSEQVAHAAVRLYTLALEHKFTRGRRALHVVAVCLYVACRQKETRQHMLIDFADLLQARVRPARPPRPR